MLEVSRSPSKKQIRTSKKSDSIVSARKLKNSRHWQGYRREGTRKPFTISHQMIEHKIYVECLSESIKETDQVIIFRSGPREISDFLVLARKVKTSRHLQGNQRAVQVKNPIHN